MEGGGIGEGVDGEEGRGRGGMRGKTGKKEEGEKKRG